MRELLAQVHLVLRRCGQVGLRADVLVTGDIVLDRNGRFCSIDGTFADLTPSEFELLAAFMAKPGYARSREELIELFHGTNCAESICTIDVHTNKSTRQD